MHEYQFDFILENKSDYSIKIIWDDAAYVNTKGASGRVIHSGIKFPTRNYPQPHTVVAKKTHLDDFLIPVENIYLRYLGFDIKPEEEEIVLINSKGQGYFNWNVKPIFPFYAIRKKQLEHLTKQYIGKTVQILLPLQIQETVNDYIFTFDISDFVIIKSWSE